jgi:hypothetical protein
VVMKSTVFWDITPSYLLKVNWLALHASCFHAGFLFSLFFDPEDAGDRFLQNVSWLQRTTQCYIPEDRTLHLLLCTYPSAVLISVFQLLPHNNSWTFNTQQAMHSLTLQRGHLNITAVVPPSVVFFHYPFKFCTKLYYNS